MPLRLELFPKQRALIGTTCVQNVGSQTISLLIETIAKLVRGKFLITADQVNTVCKELHFNIIEMYLAEKPSEHQARLNIALQAVSEVIPTSVEVLQIIWQLVSRGEFYPALKQSLTLVSLEAQLRNDERPTFNKLAPGAAPTRCVELGPSERLVIGSVFVRNCEIRARLAIDAHANFIQGKYLLEERDADTFAKRLYIVMQNMCMATDPAAHQTEFDQLASRIASRTPSAVPRLAEIHMKVGARQFLQGMAAGRELIEFEASSSIEAPLRKSA